MMIGIRKMGVALAALLVLFASVPAMAQQGAYVAFLNGSSQLLVSDSTGSYRWIVTNPGEYLALPLGYTWSPDGGRLFFGIDLGGEVSLRVGDLGSQAVTEIGRAQSGATGGMWTPDGGSILVASGGRVLAFSANGGGSQDRGEGAALISPFGERGADAEHGSLSPNGGGLLALSASGSYLASGAGGTFALPTTNSADAPGSGLWANGSLVAYWGYQSNAVLAVTNTNTGETATLDSGRATPVTPFAWLQGTRLVYRDGDGRVRAADMGCLLSGCGGDPFAAAVDLLSPTATEVGAVGTLLVYVDGGTLYGLPGDCIANGSCGSASVALGAQIAPNTPYTSAGSLVVYTSYSANPNDPNDRTVMAVDSNCVFSGGCAPSMVLNGAVAGVASAGGRTVTVEGPGTGLAILDLGTGATTSLAEYTGGQLLGYTRWN